MVTLKDIAKAINAKLKESFPDIQINTKDISEGFARPSFTVDFDNSTKSPFGSHGVERTVHVIIYFFPSDRSQYKIEMLDVQDKLENAFTYTLTILDGFVVYLDELSSDKVDGVLQFAFDIHYIEIDYTDDVGEDGEVLEDIENLNLNI
ncbi:phage tail terminator family protein [Paenibacillus sp. Root444D2]|uniref:phage tail terminator family protein n=1 Tax=Paenibacillus sp. Root444D2 TaxID=1736538 RepID=UPI0007C70DCD|nr:hypothetical protein [Paenibacillus sp. Root444D2]